MELLIAVLIALGVVSTDEAKSLDQSNVDKLIEQNDITSKQIEEQTYIIGLEESDI